MRIKNLSLKDLAIFISDYLRKNDVKTILTGGACVSIYTNNKFKSYDMDFVLIYDEKQKKVKELLEIIGFYQQDRYFKHKDTKYFIDFLKPPPSVGNEPVKEINEITRGSRKLKLLSPTDCVKDRLAAFYHWKDRQSLEQAILVSLDNNVDLIEIERWSHKQGKEDEYKEFKKNITDRKA